MLLTSAAHSLTETEVPTTSHRTAFLPRIVTLVAAGYGLALLIYLLLRLTLRDSLWWLAFLNNFAPYYFAPLLVLIPALLILSARRTALRLLPLLLVGLLIYGPRWLPHASVSAEDSRSLRVVTFNILVLTHQFDRMAAWLRTTDADIVLLQETGGMQSAQIFGPLSDRYPYTVDLAGTTVTALSRYPVTEAHIVDLGSWYIDRFVLDVEGQALAVYNVHMQWPMQNAPHLDFDTGNGFLNLALKYDESHRNWLLHNLLDILAAEDLPYIVAGDFNTSDNAMIYDELAAVLDDSFRETSTGLGATWPASIGDDDLPSFIPPLLRIDYVWHSAGLHALSTEIGPDLGSDHLPVIATLTLPG